LDLSPYILDPETGQPVWRNEESTYLQALRGQLGLRLEPKRAPPEVMVIEHVEKDHTAN
jgi:uncharacterized protein (TIGR03435 family)